MANFQLTEIAKLLKKGRKVPAVSVRTFLLWFYAQRRGYWVVVSIRRQLREAGLETIPDFESAYIDALITFSLIEKPKRRRKKSKKKALPESLATGETSDSKSASTPGAYADPTYRISKLEAANNKPTFVAPDDTVQHAVTLMLANDFSQLPAMTSEREVKGVISWTSIGARLALGKGGQFVRELMDFYQELPAQSSLFQAIPIIADHQYVLIRGNDQKITGIVTASDLNRQFEQLAEPFLLLGEIENHVRRILGDKFSKDELAALRDPNDGERKIEGVADLTFGEYIRLLENDSRWEKIKLKVDRKAFCAALDRVREIRNDVMHFDPDGIPREDLEKLRDFAQFLRRLQVMGVT